MQPWVAAFICYGQLRALYISISCGSISGQLYVDKMDESKRSSGKCVLVSGAWYSPSEVEALYS